MIIDGNHKLRRQRCVYSNDIFECGETPIPHSYYCSVHNSYSNNTGLGNLDYGLILFILHITFLIF